MIYLLDDDQHNAIINTYSCNFLFEDLYNSKILYINNEYDIRIDINKLDIFDFVCFHNSFPNEKTKFIDRLKISHETSHKFFLICFSSDSSFFNTYNENRAIKVG